MAAAFITREDARAQGLKRYFTGDPCKQGHVAERYVSSLMCVECCVLILRRRYEDNPEGERQRSRAWRDSNPDLAKKANAKYCRENPDKRRAAEKRWREANPDKVKEMARRARLKRAERHPEASAEYYRRWLAKPENRIAQNARIRAWQVANPDKVRAATRNRRAKIAGSLGEHTAADLAEILDAQGNRCAYCKVDLRRVRKHVDHITPIARGGSNGRANLQYLCQPCNQTKNSKDPNDFARSLGLLI